MGNQKLYEKTLRARVKSSERNIRARKNALGEIKSFGDALCKVVGKVKHCRFDCLLQDIPPLPIAATSFDSECNGYLLVLLMRYNADATGAVPQDKCIPVLSCWFSSGTCFSCEIRANDKVYKCANMAKVKDSLIEVSKGCLVPILSEVEGLLSASDQREDGLGVVTLIESGPTGNVEPAAGEPSSSDLSQS